MSADSLKGILLVTGGCGFIGSAYIRHMLAKHPQLKIVNVDKMDYCATEDSTAECDPSRYVLVKQDLCELAPLQRLLDEYQPQAIIHFAAESHVDRSINTPLPFVRNNVDSTLNVLEASHLYLNTIPAELQKDFRLHHISTDEVYGSLGETGLFTEETAYDPSSPYSASKAATDHLVRAWQRTYDLPVLISNCSNNYGPFQFPEKLIPLMIRKILAGEDLPIYGEGLNVRDWLHVDDHVKALELILIKGEIGRTYNIGGNAEARNIDLVHSICDIVTEELADKLAKPARELICFVKDRPGHDLRYAIDSSRIRTELGWLPEHDLTSGLRQTVSWYLNNETWWKNL